MGQVNEILFMLRLPYAAQRHGRLGDYAMDENSDFLLLNVDNPPATNPCIQLSINDPTLKVTKCDVYTLDFYGAREERIGHKTGNEVREVPLDQPLEHGTKLEIVLWFNKKPDVDFDLVYAMPPDAGAKARVIIT